MIGDHGLASIYNPFCATRSFALLETLAQKSKSQKINTLFSEPNTAIKSINAPKQFLYLTHDYIKENGIVKNVQFEYLTQKKALTPLKEFKKPMQLQFEQRGFTTELQSTLLEVDPIRQEATFSQTIIDQGKYSETTKAYEVIRKNITTTKPYDLLHIIPHMSAPKSISESNLVTKKSPLLDINPHTLQHKKYPNIFGLGDIISTPLNSSGASVQKQIPVVVENLLQTIHQKELVANYNGYTHSTLFTGYGSAMMMEFNYKGVAPTFSFLDPTKERYIWWLLNVYGMKPLYFHALLKGLI
jgi:sulfide:quinone oxidoreductase